MFVMLKGFDRQEKSFLPLILMRVNSLAVQAKLREQDYEPGLHLIQYEYDRGKMAEVPGIGKASLARFFVCRPHF
jgi:hypothetical protein